MMNIRINQVVLLLHFLVDSLCVSLQNGNCSCEKLLSVLKITCTEPSSSEICSCFTQYNDSRNLEFKHSHLMQMPSELKLLRRIVIVDFSYNNIVEVNFSKLTYVCSRIEQLVLNFNNISVLKNGSLDCFSNLRSLSITNNRLKYIETHAFNKKLRKFLNLDAQYNDLLTLDTSVFSMLSNETSISANVSYNKITHFTNSASMTIDDLNESEAIMVWAMHNNITHISRDYFFNLFNITHTVQIFRLIKCSFDLRFNPIICECEIFQLAQLLKKLYIWDPNSKVFALTCGSPPALHGKLIVSVNDWDFNCTIIDKCPSGCKCTETISLDLLTIHCDKQYRKKNLSIELPVYKAIRLHINNSPLQMLVSRQYLENVTFLDVSQNDISVADDIIPMLGVIETVFLQENRLEHMPKLITRMNFTKLKVLTLHGNPFKCDCHTLWFKQWLITHQSYVPNQDKILCNTGPGYGKPIIKVDDSDFICPGPLRIAEIAAILVGVLFLVMVVVLFICAKWVEIQVLLIAQFNVRWFTKKVRSDLKYDIFISHSSLDDDIVHEKIIARLENHDPPFVVCRDDRDFAVGRTIAYNIITKIESSLTTLIVVSNNFLRSDWCKMEFKQAHLNLLKEKRASLLLVVLEDLDPELMDKEIRHYVNTHVYVKINDKYFWPKLLQALPVREITERTPLMAS